MERVAILGGSFNPIHIGHLIIAESVLDNFDFDKILFIPNGYNPFKFNKDSKTRKACLEMLQAALKDNPKFLIDEREISKKGKKFTYDTVKSLKKENPNIEYTFIIGADILKDLEKWYKIDKLLEISDFIVVERNNYSNTINKINHLNDKFNTKIKFLNIPEINISSTGIRNRIRLDKSIKYLTPDSVIDIINNDKLYHETEEYKALLKKIKKFLKKNLKQKRFEHSLNVMNTAMDLALKYDEDVVKAQIAGLVHDCAKSMTIDEMLDYIKKNNLDIPDEFLNNLPTLHAIVGSYLAQDYFDITDQEILNAIACHTTGKKNMSNLDKIIYLADYIEPGRTGDYLEEVRNLAEFDLNKAVLKALENTENFLKSNNKIINKSSIEAKESILKEINYGKDY